MKPDKKAYVLTVAAFGRKTFTRIHSKMALKITITEAHGVGYRAFLLEGADTC
jgi:hypothetical protein